MARRTPRLEDLLGVPRRGPGWLPGALIGGLVGAAVAWLSVPYAGAELRRLFRESWYTLRTRCGARDERLL